MSDQRAPDLSNALPPSWLLAFDGTRLESRLALSAILATVDDEDWPHLAYMSAGEILVRDAQRLYFGAWPQSRSTRNLLDSGRASLQVALDGVVWEARVRVQRCGDAGDEFTVFKGEVMAVRRHAAPYALVESLIGFTLHDPAEVLRRWQKQIDLLRQHAGSDSS